MAPITHYVDKGARYTYMRRFSEDGVAIKNLMGLNRVIVPQAAAPTTPHSHDLLEIHYVARGIQYQVVEGSPYKMKAGDMLVTRPGERHYSGSMQEKRIDYYLAIDLKTEKNRFLGYHGEEGEALRRRLARIPRFFSTDNSLRLYLDEILKIYAGKDPHKVVLILAVRAAFFVKLLAFSEHLSEKSVSSRVDAAVRFVKKNLTKPIRVGDLAREAGLAASAFRERFTREMGLPPKDFLLRQRMEAALVMLGKGTLSITDIAHELQFSSSQHFAKMFRKLFNRTPREARENAAPG